MKHVFLWTCARSCSSAFVRSIETLPSTLVISEPFQHPYYCGPQRQNRRYESQEINPNETYEETARKVLNPDIIGESHVEVVFVKDMAYYFEGRFDMIEELFGTAKHSFLIRDPWKVVTSQYRASQNPEIRAFGWTYFDPAEVGFRQLHQMYELVKQRLDPTPVVIDADDLLESPKQIMKAYCDGVGITFEEHMTSWKAGESAQAWKNSDWNHAWCKRAINSNGFIKSSTTADSFDKADVTYPADVMKAIEESQPFYDKLYSARIIPG